MTDEIFWYVRVNPKSDENNEGGTYKKAEELKDILQFMGFYVTIESEKRILGD